MLTTTRLPKSLLRLGCLTALTTILMAGAASAEAVSAKKGETANLVLLPKFLGILPFDQARRGAEEAHKELENKGTLQYIGPTPENSVAGQIEMLTTATTQKQHVVMLSNNAGDQISARHSSLASARAISGSPSMTPRGPIE